MSMRKLVFFMSMLLPLGLFSACSNDEEFEGSSISTNDQVISDGMEITTDLTDESVLSFFKEKLKKAYLAANYHAKDGFLFKENTCYRINSMEELASLYQGSDVLPEIDFDKYTLLLGSKIYTDTDTDVENVKPILFETEKDYQLNLYTHHLEGEWGSPCINLQLLYFGFYPKLKDKEIVVNLIYE